MEQYKPERQSNYQVIAGEMGKSFGRSLFFALVNEEANQKFSPAEYILNMNDKHLSIHFDFGMWIGLRQAVAESLLAERGVDITKLEVGDNPRKYLLESEVEFVETFVERGINHFTEQVKLQEGLGKLK